MIATEPTRDVHAYLERHQKKELLRFLTCGSVDDGKSTLIGRMLHDTRALYEDQLAAVRKVSVLQGTRGGEIDLALVTDGLKAEREQGITIDVAYRYFSTEKRKFIIADTPGHEQYTRNMATGASTCQLAIILIDARHGIAAQTKRHSFICSLLGIRHLVVAINKMDLVGFSEAVFERIRTEYRDFAAKLDVGDIYFVPMSALDGDNIVDASTRMPWFKGVTLLSHLETVHIASDRNLVDLRFPVQYVIRPNLDFRGLAGTVASGILRKGDPVMVLPSRMRSRVSSIVTYEGELDQACAGQAVTLTLDDVIDVSRGNMLVDPDLAPRFATGFDANVVWMSETPLQPGKAYWFKHTTRMVSGTISSVRHAFDINTIERKPATSLGLNDVGRCTVALNQEIAFDAYKANAATGSFIVIDRLTNTTVGAGMILEHDPEDRRGVVSWSREPNHDPLVVGASKISADARAEHMNQRPVTLLFTGYTLAGQTTLAYALERRLFEMGAFVTVLSGQSMRRLSRDLDDGSDDRAENLRRTAEVATILNEAGMITLCAVVAPDAALRERFRQLVGVHRFLEIHLSAPLDVCRKRDTRGLYASADAGELVLPGVNAAYEVPDAPDLVVPTHEIEIDGCVQLLLDLLAQHEFIRPVR